MLLMWLWRQIYKQIEKTWMDVDTADNNSDNESEQYTSLCVECDYDAQDLYELKAHKL